MKSERSIDTKQEFVEQIKKRTKKLAVDTIVFCRKFPETVELKIIKGQLIRCASSVASNYRAACRARSGRDFYAKISICIEESDETCFWLEVINESGIDDSEERKRLLSEAHELTSIFSKARNYELNFAHHYMQPKLIHTFTHSYIQT